MTDSTEVINASNPTSIKELHAPKESANPDVLLSPQHQQELADANQRARKVLRAGNVAAFNGWTAGIFAALSLPFAIFSIKALVVAIGLAVLAWNEFRGRKLVRQFESRGLRVLGWNQMGFMGLLFGYSLWSMFTALTGPNPFEQYSKTYPELAPSLAPLGNIHTTLILSVYGSVMIFSVICPGLTAAYYFTRTKHLHAYLNQTTAWIVNLQRCSI